MHLVGACQMLPLPFQCPQVPQGGKNTSLLGINNILSKAPKECQAALEAPLQTSTGGTHTCKIIESGDGREEISP